MIDIMLQKLEPIIAEFTTGDYYREVFQAKQEFFERAGTIYEDDPEYEQRMNLFMDWYLFDRDLPGVDLPPIRYFARNHASELSDDDKKIYQELSASIHSLFLLKGFTWFGKHLIAQDLFSRKKYVVIDPNLKQAFSRGDIFEGRIVCHNGQWHFSQGFCFHPTEMKSFIVGEIKKVRFQDPSRHVKLILQLAQMKLKHVRYAHIDVNHIYNFSSRF